MGAHRDSAPPAALQVPIPTLRQDTSHYGSRTQRASIAREEQSSSRPHAERARARLDHAEVCAPSCAAYAHGPRRTVRARRLSAEESAPARAPERLGPRIGPNSAVWARRARRSCDGRVTSAHGVDSDVGTKRQKGGGGAKEIKGIRVRRPRTSRPETCDRGDVFSLFELRPSAGRNAVDALDPVYGQCLSV